MIRAFRLAALGALVAAAIHATALTLPSSPHSALMLLVMDYGKRFR